MTHPSPTFLPVLWVPGHSCEHRCHSTLSVTPTPFPTGLFEPGDMKYEAQRDTALDPSLKEMTEAALCLLSRNPRGFYLFVEGE